MITLLASIAGFLTSLIPEIVKFFKDKNDKKHELDILSLQIEMSKLRIGGNLDEVKSFYDSSELSTLYSAFRSGISWVDAINALVRPILAYCFFGLYAYLKYIQYRTLLSAINSSGIIVDMLWTTDDQAIFAGIISFYFGQRTFSKLWKAR